MKLAEEGFPFWSLLSLEELAEQQRVLPAEDLDEIGSLWPVEDDPDKLMDHILSDRSARRRLLYERNAAPCGDIGKEPGCIGTDLQIIGVPDDKPGKAGSPENGGREGEHD